MKRLCKILIFSFIASAFLLATGCKDFHDVDSERLLFDEEYQMKSPTDTLYSMVGIFSQLQKISQNYVLLGELRGDLLDVTGSSNQYLKEINNFEISENNPYVNNIKDYYSIINNCNYVIHNIDTAYVSKGQKVMYKTFAAAKAIRAWTYMQIALNYGKAKYYTNPIVTMADANKSYPEYSITELADLLIEDLLPWKDIRNPQIGSIGSNTDTRYSYFPIRFLLGDLYLWKGDYLNAANEYRDLMYNGSYIISPDFNDRAKIANNVLDSWESFKWTDIFARSSSENITSIAVSTQYGVKFDLDSLNYKHMFKPSAAAINNWLSQQYYPHAAWNTTFRKYLSANYGVTSDSLTDIRMLSSYNDTYSLSTRISTASPSSYFINKFSYMDFQYDDYTKNVLIYRSALLYLRYAEAVNRLGKPNLAFAVLRFGLTNSNISSSKVVPKWEKPTPLPNYMNFTDVRFDRNIGIRSRGLGPVNQDSSYVIPSKSSLSDSVLYVEDLIQKELALETAFEGNRFQDLMRFAYRRNDPAYLADKVAAKYTQNKAAIRSKLMNTANWFIK
ncbi:MAG: RagB/SusD family nutrient uptake outer membrane protein [Bacteroidota bacterium]|nr:RagB/SusD family nutrient uptake outer membrane protein [Bacteroidota bacterium]